MKYTHIPGTELKPSLISLGTVSIGSSLDQNSSFQLLDAYLDQGGNFIDTARVYSDWLPIERQASEKTIGRWLASRKNRDRVILATKGAHPELATMHLPRMSRAGIVYDLDESLKNLQTEIIDLYWLHRDAPNHPVEDIIEVLNDQVKAGKIRYFGCSNWRTERIKAAQDYAARHGRQGFSANQMMWSLAIADPDKINDKTIVVMDEVMTRYHRATGLAATPYTSQAHGLFQRMAQGTVNEMSANNREVYHSPENERRFQRLQRLAAETGFTVSQIVLAYLHSQPFTVIPIVGCRTLDQLRDSLTAVEISLAPAQLNYLEGGSDLSKEQER